MPVVAIFEYMSDVVKATYIFLVILACCLWHFLMPSSNQQCLFEQVYAPPLEFTIVCAIAAMTEW